MSSEDLPPLACPVDKEEDSRLASAAATAGSPPVQATKRPCSAFKRLVDWVVSQDGGYVHASIRMREVDQLESETDEEGERFLFVDNTKSVDDDDDGKVIISKGQDVFRIPYSLLVTRANIPCDFVGVKCLDLVDDGALHLNRQDLLLAWYLSSNPPCIIPYKSILPNAHVYAEDLPRLWPEDTLRKLLQGSPLLDRVQKLKVEVQNDYDTLSKAHASNESSCSPLPAVPAMPAFGELSHNLAVVSSRAFEGMEGFQVFGGRPSDVTLIPLLDLCNHRRRRGSSTSSSTSGTNNLSYSFDATAKVILVQATADLMAGDQLTITYGAKGNSQLLLNYGFCLPNNVEPDGSSNTVYELAVPLHRGCPTTSTGSTNNHSLLLLELRAGPKSYSYGGFVKALEFFMLGPQPCQTEQKELPVVAAEPSSSAAAADMTTTISREEDTKNMIGNGNLTNHQPNDDMEAFLNECDDENDQYDDEDEQEDDENSASNDVFYLASGNHERFSLQTKTEMVEAERDSNEAETIKLELSALDSFRTCLASARSKYTSISRDDRLQCLVQGQGPFVLPSRERDASKRYHAALLIQSELRTIFFFELAIHRLRHALERSMIASNNEHEILDPPVQPETCISAPLPPPWMDREDAELIYRQVEELVNVFLGIRHPTIDIALYA